MAHNYISTACIHEAEDSTHHESCRKTCKFCGARCSCPNHHPQETDEVTSWVDQARDIARELLGMVILSEHFTKKSAEETSSLIKRIAADPSLFWLRGKERQTGERR